MAPRPAESVGSHAARGTPRQWAKGHAVGHGDRTRRWLVPVVVVVVAAIVGSGFVILFVDTGTAAGASISLESAQSAGIDPFTRTVAIGEVADFPTHIAPITRTVTASLSTDTTTGGLTATGNAPGLYGGTGNNGVCDPHQLADYLTRTPAKAAAWAATLGITTKQIPAYVATLTPVVLTTDTRVTNHGYANGAATPRQSILQAGTAVLVDHYGIPRVKCGCGNPLTEPTSQPIPTTTGTPWTGYTPDQVTTITPAPRPQPDLTLTNITTGRTYTQPTGTRGTDQNGESSGTLDDAALLSRVVPDRLPGRGSDHAHAGELDPAERGPDVRGTGDGVRHPSRRHRRWEGRRDRRRHVLQRRFGGVRPEVRVHIAVRTDGGGR